MRLLIISDIHGNLTAFETVLEHANGEWDQIWFLGDLVGYGPKPDECVKLLREHDHVALSGNHDWAVLSKLDISTFNPEAQHAIQWTQEHLSEESIEYLDQLPPMAIAPPNFTLAHASPRHPVWEYILDAPTAAINFEYFNTPFCLIGHTHTPVFFELNERKVILRAPNYDQIVDLKGFQNNRLIINPGSVGQPRDSDPRAAYAILDTAELTWDHRRIAYDVPKVQKLMQEADLPERLIMRLEHGW